MMIIQVTDIHIGGVEQETRGVDTRQNLLDILDAIKGDNPDHLVLTGDLCFKEPRDDVYEWVRDTFEQKDLTPLVIAGNHDRSESIAEYFNMPITDSEIYYYHDWEGTRVIFLDTALASMSEAQWSWFESCSNFAGPVVIFMHHPPLDAGVPYMAENHAFRQMAKFKACIGGSSHPVHVFCGHYHVDKSISSGNLHVHITPSTYFQIRDDIQEFGVDHYRIGYRIIELDKGVLRHRVRYL